MAGGTQHPSGGSIIKTPSSVSDGTVADTPLCDTPAGDREFEQHGGGLRHGSIQNGGPAHDEIAPLGADIIKALRVVGKLERLALDKQEISLPKCIVLGQQSTGKSSVIEAISGIKTPRDTGTCTRCPLFIELQPTPDSRGNWHAEISLFRQYDLDLDPSRHGFVVEFQGWTPASVPERSFFAETDDPAQLEHIIRCAQRATLSPLENPASFLDPSFDDSDIHKTLFSPNIVCITVSKPNVPPLSFFDLPGMIGQAETDDEAFTVPLIENLVTKYIMDPEALVLVTCALESDVANSIAAGLAKRKGVTDRCMGVLTKPDRLPAGESPRGLADILEGRRFLMGHGYFVVKNLNSDEISRGLTHQDARQLENDFFTTTAPWATQLKTYHARYGTLNMQHYLSSQLGNRVLAKLPQIYRKFEEQLVSVEEELDRIPEVPLYTAVRTVADVLESFSRQISSEMAGDHGHVVWKNTWKDIQKTFWDDLLMLKPTMRVAGDRDKGVYEGTLVGGSADDSILIDSDSDAEVPETPSKRRKINPPPTPIKRDTQTPAPTSSPFKTPQKPSARLPQPSTPTLIRSNNLVQYKRQLKLDEIALQISQSAGSDVRGQIDRKARDEMMLSTLEHWPIVINTFFSTLEQQLKARMLAIFETHFRHWKGSELYSASLTIFNGMLDNHLNEQRVTMADESFKDERTRLHLFHYDVFDMEKTCWIEKCANKRLEARINVYTQEAADRNGGVFSAVDEAKLKKDERRMAVLRREPYRVEIDLVADMIAHYTIAARRIHDKITMRIESKFFEQLREKLRDELQGQLGIYDGPKGPRKAQRLLAESPERLDRRNMLVAKRKNLIEGLRYIEEHDQGLQTHKVPREGAIKTSNYQRPSALTPPTDEMGDVQSLQLSLRSVSRSI